MIHPSGFAGVFVTSVPGISCFALFFVHAGGGGGGHACRKASRRSVKYKSGVSFEEGGREGALREHRGVVLVLLHLLVLFYLNVFKRYWYSSIFLDGTGHGCEILLAIELVHRLWLPLFVAPLLWLGAHPKPPV